VVYGISNSSNSDDLEWHSRSFTYTASLFKCDFSYSCAALDRISTDVIYASRGPSAIVEFLDWKIDTIPAGWLTCIKTDGITLSVSRSAWCLRLHRCFLLMRDKKLTDIETKSSESVEIGGRPGRIWDGLRTAFGGNFDASFATRWSTSSNYKYNLCPQPRHSDRTGNRVSYTFGKFGIIAGRQKEDNNWRKY